MSSSKNLGYEVLETDEEKVISYYPASFSLWLHIPVLIMLVILSQINLIIMSLIILVWGFITIRSKQKNEIFISNNKVLVGNDSVNLDQINGFILTNVMSENKIKVGITDVIKTDEIINQEELSNFFKVEKFKNAFQINMLIGNTEKRLAWNLNEEQAKNLLIYFAQGQYLISQ